MSKQSKVAAMYYLVKKKPDSYFIKTHNSIYGDFKVSLYYMGWWRDYHIDYVIFVNPNKDETK